MLSISLWFLSLEPYINSLCKVVSIKLGNDSESILNTEIGSRISFLLKNMGYDEMAIKKTGIYNRINDFRQFRNEIFHDRNSGIENNFKKINFSKIPFQSNQIDIFQSLLNFIEVATLFRYSISGLDLMPSIPMVVDNIIHYEKLDILYDNYLKLYFEATLKKHNFRTKLDLQSKKHSLSETTFFNFNDIVVIGRVTQEDKYIYNLNNDTTELGRNIYNGFTSTYQFPKGYNKGYNFMKQ